MHQHLVDSLFPSVFQQVVPVLRFALLLYVQLRYTGFVTFDWDDRKEAANIKKHGVDFWEAQTVFFDPLAKQFQDSHPSEERFVLIGHSARTRLILVIFAERDGDEIRIISARKPTVMEKRVYEEGI